MPRESVALHLISRLYQAAVQRSQWDRFATELSEAMGGAAVTLAIRQPEARVGWSYFGAGSHDLAILVAEDLQGALLRAARRVEGFRRGFVNLSEAFPRIELERNPWFREWLRPRGVDPTWPLCHAVSVDRSIRCWIIVQPSPDQRSEHEGIAALGAQLVPHFARAFGIHHDLRAQGHKQRALEEVLDRLSTGIVLIDASRRVIHTNLSAQRMISLDDGVALRDGRLRAGTGDDAAIQAAIDAAIQAASRGDFEHLGRARIDSTSGRRPFLLSLTPLLGALPGSPIHDAIVLAILANPDATSSASVQALQAVYGLTTAEAAVVRGLVEGRCIEEIAAERGVKPDTARSQLKQVFAKTRTSRQAELIRLVVTGVVPLSQTTRPGDGGSP